MGMVPDLQLYKDFHLRWHFSGERWRQNAEDHFEIFYGTCSRAPMDFRSECVQAAKDLEKISTLPIAVLFSGGVDSEIICRSFKNAGVPFLAIIFRFRDGLNEHDVSYALSICQRHAWKYEVIEFDIVSWLDREMYGLAQQYQIIHPEYSVHMRMIEMASELGYFPIDGRGDISLVRDGDLLTWDETEESLMPTKFMIENGIEGCPRFFKFSPELIYSWLTDSMMVRWVKYHVPLKMRTSHDFKSIIYSSYWEDLEPRIKYTGFERVMKLYRIHRERLSKMGFISMSKKMEYFETVKNMSYGPNKHLVAENLI